MVDARGNADRLKELRWVLSTHINEHADRVARFLGIDPCRVEERVDERLKVIEVLDTVTLADVTITGCLEKRRDLLAFAAGRPKPGLALRAYISQLVGQVANSVAREVETVRRKPLEEALLRIAGAEQTDDKEDQKRRLHAALEALPPKQRDAVISYFFVGGTQLEAASRIGVTRDELQTMLYSAYGRIAGNLARIGETIQKETGSPAIPSNERIRNLQSTPVRRKGLSDG
jgi:RNA polymerase sigma factor (sigma-70 family)